MADDETMMSSALYCAGFLAMSLVLLGMARRLGLTRFLELAVFVASGGLVGAAWLGSRYDMSPFCNALQGALIAPACSLPVLFALTGRVEGLTRAAMGLGASPATRLRYLWLPLLRLPIVISALVFFICLAMSLFLAGHSRG